jgi:hypothetical protein
MKAFTFSRYRAILEDVLKATGNDLTDQLKFFVEACK